MLYGVQLKHLNKMLYISYLILCASCTEACYKVCYLLHFVAPAWSPCHLDGKHNILFCINTI